MHEHQPGVGIDGSDRPQREYVLGAFQHPAVRGTVLYCKWLRNRRWNDSRQMPRHVGVQPAAVRRDVVIRVEPQAAKHMRGDLAAFLRGLRLQRMQCAELRASRSNIFNCRATWATRRSRPLAAGQGEIVSTPAASGWRIGHHQPVQKRRAAARQAGDEDRPLIVWVSKPGRAFSSAWNRSRLVRNRSTSHFVAPRPTRRGPLPAPSRRRGSGAAAPRNRHRRNRRGPRFFGLAPPAGRARSASPEDRAGPPGNRDVQCAGEEGHVRLLPLPPERALPLPSMPAKKRRRYAADPPSA